MKRPLKSALWLVVIGLAGCGSDDTVMLDPSKLKPETEEQIKQSQEYDAKINEEEGGNSFGARPVKKTVSTPKR
jgi:hypothetical protein